MHLTSIALSNVRNYARLDLDLAPGLNLFVGANAQGKSNLLEAIALLGTGKSFRTTRDGDLVRDGYDLAVVRGDAQVRAGTIRLGCTVVKNGRTTRKTYTINGERVRYARFLGSVRVVTFVPVDLQLASGPPSMRRAFLNAALAQEDRRYYHELVRYGQALAQKAAMLRGIVTFDDELFTIYNRVLIESGTVVMLARDHFTHAVAREAQAVHAAWTHDAEQLDVRYAPNVPFEAATADAIGAAFTARLREVADAERARRMTLAGPHRDDVALFLDGHSLEAFGSQGQQRTAVLALKVAEYAV